MLHLQLRTLCNQLAGVFFCSTNVPQMHCRILQYMPVLMQGMGVSVRHCLLKFALSFLVVADSDVISSILELKGKVQHNGTLYTSFYCKPWRTADLFLISLILPAILLVFIVVPSSHCTGERGYPQITEQGKGIGNTCTILSSVCINPQGTGQGGASQ